MAPRRWTKERTLAELVSRCDLPSSGTIHKSNKQTALVYTDSGLHRQLLVYPDRQPGLLRWQVDVKVPDLGRPGTADFATRYTLPREPVIRDGRLTQRYDSGYDWPIGDGPVDQRLIDDVRRFAASMLWFLKDRQELGRLLLAGNGNSGTWENNGITASPWSGAPAGLVQALILARVTGDTELEALAYDKPERERDHIVIGFGGTFPQAVGYWAEQIVPHSPVDISDLLGPGRPARRKR
ncbi:hypothetical protein RB614_15565 [Phytohabitans sp. ZYX-F-186]|uniref:Uncharacterized protein n=1 Tax=Phytohabitans maris TaxID=3071409 RepID=A0ABU0ZHN8_9ACTN|nr:hypothetical protein [Phytohabitans sp. ZYX-F-186]MDQ7905934.1 hypothetical protein [Phytohabitans sp. ZYX-F-186]